MLRKTIFAALLGLISTTVAFGDAQVTYTHTDAWGPNLFEGSFHIDNPDPEAIVDWKITFQADYAIQQVWNGTILSKEGNTYTIGVPHWSNTIEADSSLDVGFLASFPDTLKDPEKAKFNDMPILVENIDADDANIQYTGRFDANNPKAKVFSWSGSQVVAQFEGSLVNLRLDNNSPAWGDCQSNFYNVSIDGQDPIVLEATNDKRYYEVAADLAEGPHSIQIVKRTEATCGTGTFLGLQLEKGKKLLAAPARPERRIEFIGDSITVGYGVEGKDKLDPFLPSTENYTKSFAAIAAKKAEAESVAIGISGKGVYRNTDGATAAPLPDFYSNTNVLGAPDWDFQSWIPHVVVVNLGTNDFTQNPPPKAEFVDSYVAFVQRIKNNYPNATMVLVDGPMLSNWWPLDPNGAPYKSKDLLQAYIKETIAKLNEQGIENVHSFSLTPSGSLGYGSNWHPSAAQQEFNGNELGAFIKRIMKWEKLTTIEADNPNYQYSGRIDFSNPKKPAFSWSGVSIETVFEGRALNLVLENESPAWGYCQSNFYNVTIDDNAPVVLEVTNGQSVYEITDALEDRSHTLKISRRTEAVCGVTKFVGVQLIEEKGLQAPEPKPQRKIEFIGDSPLIGYGVEGTDPNQPFLASTENFDIAYAALTAKKLGAEQITVAYPGKGIYRNQDNSTVGTMPTLYDKAVVQTGATWNFQSWTPDAVVINLGTNDFGSSAPAEADFVNAYVNFVQQVKGNYPASKIFLLDGPTISNWWPMGPDGNPIPSLNIIRGYIAKIVETLNANGVQDVYSFSLTSLGAGGHGAAWHPGAAHQVTNATELAAFIENKMGWGQVNEATVDHSTFGLTTTKATPWKNGATAAYSIMHDDYCSNTQGLYLNAKPELESRGLKASFAPIVGSCSSTHYDEMKTLLAQGHEIVNHSWSHEEPANAGWNDALEIDQAHAELNANLPGVDSVFYAFPYDTIIPEKVDYIRQKGYIGTRGPGRGVNSRSFETGLGVNFDLYSPYAMFTLEGYVNEAIKQEGWALQAFHGVEDTSWSSVPLVEYTTLLDRVKAEVDAGTLWMDTPSTVIKYRFAREKCSIGTFVEHGTGLKLKLDASSQECIKYATAITYELTTTNDPAALTVTQDGATTTAVKVGANHFRFDVNPMGGDVIITP